MFDFLAFISFAAIAIYTPGPNNIMAMTHSQKFGLKDTLKFLFGVLTGVTILVFISCIFNLFMFENISLFKWIIGPIGAIYMLYLAYLIAFKKDVGKQKEGKGYNSSAMISYPTGIILQFINPKGVIFAITIASSFILPFFKNVGIFFLFSVGMGIFAFTSVFLWAVFGSLFNRFFKNYGKVFNYIMAALLCYSAISISGVLDLL